MKMWQRGGDGSLCTPGKTLQATEASKGLPQEFYVITQQLPASVWGVIRETRGPKVGGRKPWLRPTNSNSSWSSDPLQGILSGAAWGAKGCPGSAKASPPTQQMHSRTGSPSPTFVIHCTPLIAIPEKLTRIKSKYLTFFPLLPLPSLSFYTVLFRLDGG